MKRKNKKSIWKKLFENKERCESAEKILIYGTVMKLVK